MKESDASAIALLPQSEGRVRLLENLNIVLDFGYDERLRSTIHTDLLYDTFTHAVLKGFAWRDVCTAVHLSQQLLKDVVGKTLIEATRVFQEAALSSGMENRNLAIYTDFFFSTFMQHYKLYQYVFQSKRDLTSYVTDVVVEVPVPPEELRYAKPPALHEYDQHLRQIHANQETVKEIDLAAELNIDLKEDVTACSQTEALQKIISQVMTEIGKPLLENVSTAIASSYNDLNVKLEETALARPKQLGPPTRYQLKPVIPMPKVTAAASLKPPVQKGSAKGERKKSGKAK